MKINKYASDLKYKILNYSQLSKISRPKHLGNQTVEGNQLYRLYKLYTQLGFSITTSNYELHNCTMYNYIHDNLYINKYIDILLKTGIPLKDKDYCLIVIQSID